jgi:predicted ATPase
LSSRLPIFVPIDLYFGGAIDKSLVVVGVVGRGRELSLAEEFLDRMGKRLAVLVLEGEAGIGKTTVWRDVVRGAMERKFVVLACRPAETEAKFGLSANADLLEPVPRRMFRVLPKPQRRALDVALLRAGAGDEVADQRTVATAVRSLIRHLASDAPVLLAVDDVQWLDPALRRQSISSCAGCKASESASSPRDEFPSRSRSSWKSSASRRR